jgi:hypothetical protein
MTRRALLVLATLCVASFCVPILLNWLGGAPARGAAQPPAVTSDKWPAAQPEFSPTLAAAGSVDTGEIVAPIEAPPDFESARRDAKSAAIVDERIRALQVLAEAPPEVSTDVLTWAATGGEEANERATAVVSLRQLAQRGPMDPRIRNALQAAASDADPMVVMLAQTALEDLDTPR